LSRYGCLLLVLLASTQIVEAAPRSERAARQNAAIATPTSQTVPTVTISRSTSVPVPTVWIPEPTATPVPPAPQTKAKKARRHAKKPASQDVTKPRLSWVWAYLTSYCPGSAGWLSSSGQPVFYGMLANDFYPFGTRVYLPVIGITGVVEDRLGSYDMWNHFDVWSAVCYSTPTGWFKVGIAK
jgi:hypothetical protein